jgi:hypothetical protein
MTTWTRSITLLVILLVTLLITACSGSAIYFGNGTDYFSIGVMPVGTVAIPAGQATLAELVESGASIEALDSETIPLDNCHHSSSTEITVQRTRKVEHVITVETSTSASVDLLHLVMAGLQERYGVVDGETEEQSYAIKLQTGPGTASEHTINWSYVWQQGTATVHMPDGTLKPYPYHVRMKIEPKVISTEKSCN